MTTYILIAAVCISVTWLCYKWLLANRTVLKAIRWYFLLSIGISFILPLSNFRIEIDKAPAVRVIDDNTNIVSNRHIVATQTSSVDYNQVLLYVYLAVVLLLLIRTGSQMYRLYTCYQSSQKELHDGVTIVWNTKFKQPFTFFKLIFLNKIQHTDLEKILAHERVHANQFHSIDIILMEIVTALLWFNPFVWKMRQSMQLIHEYLADEGVLQAGIDKVQYQQLLLDHIIENNVVSISSALNQSLIKKRFIMMSAKKSNPGTKYKILYLAPVALLLLAGVGYVNGQTAPVVTAVAPTKMNVLYIGIQNPVTISVSGYEPDEVDVKTNNGTITGSNGQYIAKPASAGTATIIVTAKGKVVSESAFRVKFLPPPVVALAGVHAIKGGTISKEALLKTGGVAVLVENGDVDVPITVNSFVLGKIGSGAGIASNGAQFSNYQVKVIQDAQRGDKILIDEVVANGPDGKGRKVPGGMVFTIE